MQLQRPLTYPTRAAAGGGYSRRFRRFPLLASDDASPLVVCLFWLLPAAEAGAA